eukprot:s8048_g2.t1
MKRDPNPVSCPEILKKIAGLHAWVPHMSDDRKCDYVNACTELHPEFEALSGSPYCFTFNLRWLEDDRDTSTEARNPAFPSTATRGGSPAFHMMTITITIIITLSSPSSSSSPLASA